MKILFLSGRTRHERFSENNPVWKSCELIFCDREADEETVLAAGADAEVLVVTPVTPVPASLIARMPRLRLIHSEGVGWDRIDCEAARQRGIYVCSNSGCNSQAVAELSITFMGMLLRRIPWGDRLVREGRQLEASLRLGEIVPADLSTSTVGLVGFGNLGRAAARLLHAYGSTVYYYARHRAAPEVETEFHATWLPLQKLAETADIVGLYLPGTPETHHLVDDTFFSWMKPGAYLVNMGRGATVDDEALCRAIRSGRLAGAALDCYEPEPVPADHPLVQLAAEYPDALVLSPHHGGISQAAFQCGHDMLFANLQRLLEGKRPERVVNGVA